MTLDRLGEEELDILNEYHTEKSQDSNEEYDEELGVLDLGSEVNRSIRNKIKNPLVEMAKEIRARYEAARKSNEYIASSELRGLARELKKAGADLPPYSRMRSHQLYVVLGLKAKEILRDNVR